MAEHPRAARAVKVYRVGGSVRDELLGRPVSDRDWVVVGATPEMLVASGYRPVGRDFPVFLHPDTREEYALARTERKHGRGYRGFEFFVSPEVPLEEDLRRRDLTINAMARAEDGTLIDPFGGARDLAAGVLRHVSPAFAEDPLRVLRVARFAARFGFTVARETRRLMREIAASGELGTLAPERVWQELSRGLMEPHPSRMLAELHACGALAQLLPEVAARFAAPAPRRLGAAGAGSLAAWLDLAAAEGRPLPVRYAVLACDLAAPQTTSRAAAAPARGRAGARAARLADRLSSRLRVPMDCRDAARLAARHRHAAGDACALAPAALLDLLTACDALRRRERLDALIAVAHCTASAPERGGASDSGRCLRAALDVVKAVDAGRIARREGGSRGAAGARIDPIARAVRRARLVALRAWKRGRASETPSSPSR